MEGVLEGKGVFNLLGMGEGVGILEGGISGGSIWKLQYYSIYRIIINVYDIQILNQHHSRSKTKYTKNIK